MTARFGLIVATLALLPPGAALAQGVPRAAAAPAPDRVAWFERYQADRKGDGATDTLTKTFTVGSSGSLDIFNLSGDVVITGVSGDRIVVKAVKETWGRTRPEDVLIDASETAGRVEVRTMVGGSKARAEVTFTVEVPYGTTVTARTMAGDIKVVDVRGDVQMDSTSGTVEAVRTPRLVRLKTVSGDVMMDEAAATDALSASTISGDLVATGLKARTLEVVTVSGDVKLVNAVCERAQLRTVNGDLEYTGPVSRGGRYEFNSHSGDVHFQLVGGGGFELSARTFNGDVRTDLPMTMAPRPAEPEIPGVPGNSDVRGTFGDGSALIVVKTFSGSVVVGRAEPGSGKGRGKHKPDKGGE
jgi:DUF4097 and DUF4098 domain-containing protein YvlB